MSMTRRGLLLSAGVGAALADGISINPGWDGTIQPTIRWSGWNTSMTSLAINGFWTQTLGNHRYRVSVVVPLDVEPHVVVIHHCDDIYLPPSLSMDHAWERGWKGGNDRSEWDRIFEPEMKRALQALVMA